MRPIRGSKARATLLLAPTLLGDAVRGNHDAGAIGAIVAMDKELLLRIASEEGQELGDLRVGRRRHSSYRNIDEAHSQSFGPHALPRHRATIATKIHNG